MKKRTVLFVAVFLLCFSITTWGVVIYSHFSERYQFRTLLKAGDDFFNKAIYIDAVEAYQQAVELRPRDANVWLKLAATQEMLGNENGFLAACQQIQSILPKEPKGVIREAEYYLAMGKVQEAYQALNRSSALKQHPEVQNMLADFTGKYEFLYTVFDTVQTWHDGYVVAGLAGKVGLLSTTGENLISYQFEAAGGFSPDEGVLPVRKNGEWFYVDVQGNRKLVGEKPYLFLGTFADGLAPAQVGRQFGYIDRSFQEYAFRYAYTGSFAKGVAAVENSNGKWSLINRQFKSVGKQQFDEILLDENGFCSQYGVAFAREEKQFFLIDLKGKKKAETGYEDVKVFVSEQPAAVKQDGRWGFVDQKGELILAPTYEAADSFSLGLAPVKQDGLWGYINQKGEMVIAPTFTEAKPFSAYGTAAVQLRNSWRLIQLITSM